MTDFDRSPVGIQPHVLREYALLADGERGALVGPRGEIIWMCHPRWDSDALFSALLGGRGMYAVAPTDPWYVWGGYYEEGSLIWRSRWTSASGVVECREALAFPGDPHKAVLLRRIEAVDGPANVTVELDVRSGYGTEEMQDLRVRDGIWTGRSGPVELRWSGAGHASVIDGTLRADVGLAAGEAHDLTLELSDQRLDVDGPPVSPGEAWAATQERWARAVPDPIQSLAPRDARHAYAVLTGLTSASGGMVAAATTSLPERSEAGRNYDYRYSWIRDQCFAGQAVAADQPHPLLDTAADFISARLLADGPRLMPAYTVDGGVVPGERTLDHLVGYPGGGATIGNGIDSQFQLDAFGEALLLLAAAGRHDRLDTPHWKAIDVAVDAIEKRWGDAGAGVWEIDDEHWAHSRLICAAGLRAVANLTGRSRAGTLTSFADAIVAETTRDCLHPTGRWQRSPTDPKVDAALLLPALRGAVPARDPRSKATLETVRASLTEDGYVYRFRHDQRPLRDAEGAFLLCGFLLAMSTHQQGEVSDARGWFERSRAACGPAGLFSEEYDVVQRQLRGNLPQAFVHASMLEASCRLAMP